MAGTATDLLNIARSQIGVRETGGGTRGNRQKYSTEMGMPVTEWCAIFVSWCLLKAGVTDRYAATRVTLFARHYGGLGRFNRTPSPGALVCYDWGMDGAYDHIGIVESVRPDGKIVTIEGNTNPGNGQDGVYRMVRSQANVRGYCHPTYAPARKWVPIYGMDATSWIPGRAPVYALPKRPYTIAGEQPTTYDARLVPADLCPGVHLPMGPKWAWFLTQMFDAIGWNTSGIKEGDPYGALHARLVNEWRHLHGLDKADWEHTWANLLGQRRA